MRAASPLRWSGQPWVSHPPVGEWELRSWFWPWSPGGQVSRFRRLTSYTHPKSDPSSADAVSGLGARRGARAYTTQQWPRGSMIKSASILVPPLASTRRVRRSCRRRDRRRGAGRARAPLAEASIYGLGQKGWSAPRNSLPMTAWRYSRMEDSLIKQRTSPESWRAP